MNKDCGCVENCFCEPSDEPGFFTPKEHQECGCPVGCECKVNNCVCISKAKLNEPLMRVTEEE